MCSFDCVGASARRVRPSRFGFALMHSFTNERIIHIRTIRSQGKCAAATVGSFPGARRIADIRDGGLHSARHEQTRNRLTMDVEDNRRCRPLSRARARQRARHPRIARGAEGRPDARRNHQAARTQRERDVPDAGAAGRAAVRRALARRRPLLAEPQAVCARPSSSADEPADLRGAAADATFRRCRRAIRVISPCTTAAICS